MLHFDDIATATLEQLTDELAAAGWESTQTEICDAREAMVRLHFSLHQLSLCDSETCETLRHATIEEAIESVNAGAEGHILVDGRRCYVEL
jgi:uncharacterized protein YfiM (DUF2279 family)